MLYTDQSFDYIDPFEVQEPSFDENGCTIAMPNSTVNEEELPF